MNEDAIQVMEDFKNLYADDSDARHGIKVCEAFDIAIKALKDARKKTDNEYLVVQLEDLIQELKEENEWEENDVGKAFRLGKIHAYESVLKALKESEESE